MQALFLFLFFGFVSCSKSDTQPPNVIFILTDDQGYGDLACHGNPWIQTPNLDKLHSESIRFTNYHVGTTCAPTRAGIMTGKYCNKVGAWHTVKGRQIVYPEEKMLAEFFNEAGYSTGIFGKWHLGDNYPYRPQDRGFQEALIHGGGGVGQQPDYWENDYFDDTYFHNGEPKKFKGYCTDVWFSEALKFIERNKQKPFFCYVSTNAPHGPFNVEDKYSDPYKENPNIPNPNFYGMITNIDDNIGILRNKLDELGLSRNTILIFMTDNGTSAGATFDKSSNVSKGYNAGMRGRKGSPFEGGHRVPFFIHWPYRFDSNKDITEITSHIDIAPTLIDLCDIQLKNEIDFDGVSLKPLLQNETIDWPERTIVTDTQRKEFLEKWKSYAVMTAQWRLVGKKLYDIKADPGQKNDIAEKHPEVIKQLIAEYEIWWDDVSQNAERYSYIKVGSSQENPTRLNSHDLHLENGSTAWNQGHVRLLGVANGFWPVEVVESGTYEISICRWPKESGLNLNDKAPKGEAVSGGKPYPEGKSISINKASLKINEIVKTIDIDPNSKAAVFQLNLEKGRYFWESWFTDENGEDIRSAYYVYVKKE